MTRNYSQGMTVVETMIAIAVFALLASAGYQAFRSTNALTIKSDHKSTALSLAEEGIEAARSIRDQDFTLLSAGTKGISTSTGTWQFSGSNDYTGTYQRQVVLTQVDSDTFDVDTTVFWRERSATTSVTLSSRLTNWRKTIGMASSLSINTSSANLSLLNGSRLLTGMVLSNSSGSGTTTIIQVQASWTGLPTSRRLESIRSPYGNSVWTGSTASGVTNTLITPISIAAGASKTFEVYFSANMAGMTSATFVFTFSDGSSVSTVINNPPPGL